MYSVGSINLSHLIVTIISVGAFFFIGTIIPIEALNKEGTLLRDYDSLKELVSDIKNGELIDDTISLNDFKNSGAYQNADKNMQDCINLGAKIGHNLKGNEIVHCFENANYFKDKYPNVSVPENKVSPLESESERNLTQANVTEKVEPELERNLTQANASMNAPEANASMNAPPEANASMNAPEANASMNAPPEVNASMNAPEVNVSQQVSKGKIALNVTVAKDPVTPGDNQVVRAVALDSVTGKTLDHVFIKLTIKDPIGIILKNYTATEGNLTRSFKVGYNAIGKFSILATASQAGVETRKSLPFHVQ